MLNIWSLIGKGNMDFVILFSTVFLVVFTLIRKSKTNIPGPTPLPVVGNLLQIMRVSMPQRRAFFDSLRNKYGNVFRLYYGKQMVVYFFGYNAIHNAFVKNGQKLTERPTNLPVIFNQKGGKGIIWENGEKWKRLRRFTLQAMRDFGVGKRSIEEIIMDEVHSIKSILDERQGKPISDVKNIMTTAVCNVIHNIVFGFRYDHRDKQLTRVLELIDEIAKYSPTMSFWSIVPRRIRRLLDPGYKIVLNRLEEMDSYIGEQVKSHQATYDVNCMRDFVDLYIKKIQEGTEDEDVFKRENLFGLVFDIFGAGTETTGTTMDWALLYMIGYPDIQQKCFEEIRQTIGVEKMVRMSDRSKLKYVEATVMEIQRLANIACSTFPRAVTDDVVIDGYVIPKGTVVYGSLRSAHHDDGCWNEPMKFYPERFLDENGNIKNQEFVMPFSLGPRMCPGESLAKMEMFLVFTNLIQQYKFSKVNEQDEVKFDFQTGLTNCAAGYELKAVKRV